MIGAGGQLGTELTRALVNTYGTNAVIATDLQEQVKSKFDYCTFKILNILNKEATASLIKEEKITQVYHLAAMLSANGEKNPILAWDINMSGLLNVLELAREFKLNKDCYANRRELITTNLLETLHVYMKERDI